MSNVGSGAVCSGEFRCSELSCVKLWFGME